MAEAIQVGEGGRKSKAPRWQFVVALAIAMAVALAAGGLVRWVTTRNQASRQDQTASARLPAAVEDVQNLRLQGSLEEANKKIDEGINDTATSPDIRYMLYIQKGNALFDSGDATGALAAYEQAAAIKQTAEIMRLVGDTSKQLGEKTKAIEAYQKAIPLIPPDSPVREDERLWFEEQIRILRGQS